ncbi:Imm1 family immunity protein [Kribbella sp. NPDC058245]|uniref:Imm1 family immunity protein n=1 Tax=Kribbella sp. NPDC058245 TaxID=3346399 RepID=UPI0036F112B0
MTRHHLNAYHEDSSYVLRGSRDVALLTLEVLRSSLTPPLSSTMFVQHGTHDEQQRDWGRDGLLVGLDGIHMEGSMRYHSQALGTSFAIGREARDRLAYHSPGLHEERFPQNALLDLGEIVEAVEEFRRTARRPSGFSWLIVLDPPSRPAVVNPHMSNRQGHRGRD